MYGISMSVNTSAMSLSFAKIFNPWPAEPAKTGTSFHSCNWLFKIARLVILSSTNKYFFILKFAHVVLRISFQNFCSPSRFYSK